MLARFYIAVYLLDMTPRESFLLAKNWSPNLKQLALRTFLLLRYIYIYIYIHIYVCVCVCVCMCACVCVCVYVCICSIIYLFIYLFIYSLFTYYSFYFLFIWCSCRFLFSFGLFGLKAIRSEQCSIERCYDTIELSLNG